MNRILLAALIAGGTIATAAAPAEAQRYLMRERIVMSAAPAAPSYTYAPVYGSYTSCSNGTKRASLSSCRRSDGQTVAASFCSTAATSKTVPCFTCSLDQGMWATGFGSYASTTTANAAEALSTCQAISNSQGAGTCTWNSANRQMVFASDSANGVNQPKAGAATQYGGRCVATQ